MEAPSTSKVSTQSVVRTAVTAVSKGFTPIPINERAKNPGMPSWTRQRWETAQEAEERFEEWASKGMTNIGLLLGDASGGLVDIDLDHPRTARLKDYFLPPTSMRTGRPGRPGSHYWYKCKEGTLPATRRHKMGSGEVAVELRSNGAQTVIPPSQHPSGEMYRWEGDEWAEPSEVDGRVLTVQVALLGLGTVLIDSWPQQGSRHEAYLALAGGLLRRPDGGIHPYWERNLPILIHALASATLDDDGPDSRESETMNSTLSRIRTGELVVGFGKLSELLGEETVKQVRVLIREVESAAGYKPRETAGVELTSDSESSDEGSFEEREAEHVSEIGGLDPEDRDPLNERLVSWQPVDLDPFLSGKVKMQGPEIMTRADGKSLMYRGRVNMLFGSSETAKSWIALQTCLQEMSHGERVVYLDFEDEPINTLDRMKRLGAGDDDIRMQFTYVRPEEPMAPMQRNRFGQDNITQTGKDNFAAFTAAMDRVDPSLIIADGMTVLYGLHGLDSNDSVSTDVITTWLKKLTRNGRSTVIVIDHSGKAGKKGDLPIGSQHKTSMVQGTLLQAWPLSQPMPGALGEIELVVLKDRPGKVREHSLSNGGDKAQVAALCRLDSREEETTHLTFDVPPDPKEALDNGVIDVSRSKAAQRAQEARDWEERIKHLYEGELGRGYSLKEILEAFAQFDEPGAVKAAVQRLVDQKWIEKQGKTRAQKYVLIVGTVSTLYGDYDSGANVSNESSNESSNEDTSPWAGYRSNDVGMYDFDL